MSHAANPRLDEQDQAAILATGFNKKNNSDMRLPRRCLRVLPTAKVVLAFAAASPLLAGCSPPVGSQDWCAELRAEPTGEWTADEVKRYVDACVVGDSPSEPPEG